MSRAIIALEVTAAATAVVLDAVVPTLVILALIALSLLARGQRLDSLGLRRPGHFGRLAAQIGALVVGWTAVQLAVIMPVANHLTGQRQDQSELTDVEHNLPLLAILLVLSWTVAAFGEELAYRGYVFTRTRQLVGSGAAATVAAVATSSLLFGLAHTEQGIVGVIITTCDAVFFSVLRIRFGTLWAPILAHGISNTIGLVALSFLGPVYGLW